MLSDATPPGPRSAIVACEILQPHRFDLPEARRRAEALVRRLQNELGARWSADSSRLRFNFPTGGMKGLSGTITVTTDSVVVDLRLTPTLHATRLSVESRLRGVVHETFAA